MISDVLKGVLSLEKLKKLGDYTRLEGLDTEGFNIVVRSLNPDKNYIVYYPEHRTVATLEPSGKVQNWLNDVHEDTVVDLILGL